MSTVASLALPLLIVLFVAAGVFKKVNVFDAFLAGAMNGLHSLLKIIPSLLALVFAVKLLRGSGLIDAISNVAAPLLYAFRITAYGTVEVGLRQWVNSTADRYFRNPRSRFGNRTYGVGYVLFIGNYILHHCGLLRLGRYQAHKAHSCRGFDSRRRRCDFQYSICKFTFLMSYGTESVKHL